ncbi:MAG: Fe2+ transport system protein FeoA [Paraglaciecola sp.]|jgi:Fe2+ transport system protein FeoA
MTITNEAVANLKAGNYGTVAHFTNDQMAGKLMSMGMMPGSYVEVVQVAPFKGGFYLKVDGNCIAIRVTEAANIFLDI